MQNIEVYILGPKLNHRRACILLQDMEICDDCGPRSVADNILPDPHQSLQAEAFSFYPFEDYDDGEEQYMGDLAVGHKDHMKYYDGGFLTSTNFRVETVEDVYFNNLYAMSWFYDGIYPFDTYEEQMDSYLYEETFLKTRDDEVDDIEALYCSSSY